MKISSCHIHKFYGVQNLELDFHNPETGATYNLIGLTGGNGCGKTTVLDALYMYYEGILTPNNGVTVHFENKKQEDTVVPLRISKMFSNITDIIFDYDVDFNEFAKAYQYIFPGRTISISEKSKTITIVDEKGNVYNANRASQSEYRILHLLHSYLRQPIRNSVVLIDDIELHLDLLKQKRFISYLLDTPHNNQFIITTMSPYVCKHVVGLGYLLLNLDNLEDC